MQVSLQDVSSKCSMFSLAGPQATDILTELGAPTPAAGEVQMTSCQGSPVVIAGGSELAVPGYLMIVDEAAAAELYRSLIVKVCSCMHAIACECSPSHECRAL